MIPCLHALHEHGPVIVVSVHHGGQQVHSLELRQPEALLTISHDLALGRNCVEMAVTKNQELYLNISELNMMALTWVGIWRWNFPWFQSRLRRTWTSGSWGQPCSSGGGTGTPVCTRCQGTRTKSQVTFTNSEVIPCQYWGQPWQMWLDSQGWHCCSGKPCSISSYHQPEELLLPEGHGAVQPNGEDDSQDVDHSDRWEVAGLLDSPVPLIRVGAVFIASLVTGGWLTLPDSHWVHLANHLTTLALQYQPLSEYHNITHINTDS